MAEQFSHTGEEAQGHLSYAVTLSVLWHCWLDVR